MNWNQEWDLETNGNGWNDGRCNGLSGPSLAPLPRPAARGIMRVLLVVLALAGAAGGIFQAYLCLRIIAQVVNR